MPKTAIIPYTSTEVSDLTSIAKLKTGRRKTLLSVMSAKFPGRTSGGLEAKLAEIRHKLGLITSEETVKPSPKEKNKRRGPYNKKNKEIEVTSEATITRRHNELRFPFTGIRIEGNELVVSLKTN